MMENKVESEDSRGKVKGINERVGDKVEKTVKKMSVKNSAMTLIN